MKTMVVVWLLTMGIILGPATYDTYVWHQIRAWVQAGLSEFGE